MTTIMTRRDIGRGLVAAGLATALAKPGWAQGAKMKIAFANNSDELPFSASVLKGFQAVAAKRKDLEIGFFDNKNDVAKCVDNARLIALAKFNLLVEYGVSAAANTQVGSIMKEANIPVIAITLPVPGAPIFAVDNYLSGKESGVKLAQAAKAKWAGETPVVIASGNPELSPVLLERNKGFKDGVSQIYPGIAFEELSNKLDSGVARQIATDVMTRNPGKKILFWGSPDSAALAMLAAVRTASREADCLIDGAGGDAATFTEIRKPNSIFIGTFAFFPELWGEALIANAEKMLKGEKLPDTLFPAKQLFLDRTNIQTYYPT